MMNRRSTAAAPRPHTRTLFSGSTPPQQRLALGTPRFRVTGFSRKHHTGRRSPWPGVLSIPPLPRAGCAPPCGPSTGCPSPGPPPSALALLDKTFFQYWLFLAVAATQKLRKGTGLWGSFRFFCLPRDRRGTPHPAQGTHPTSGPFVPSTELPLTCCPPPQSHPLQ